MLIYINVIYIASFITESDVLYETSSFQSQKADMLIIPRKYKGFKCIIYNNLLVLNNKIVLRQTQIQSIWLHCVVAHVREMILCSVVHSLSTPPSRSLCALSRLSTLIFLQLTIESRLLFGAGLIGMTWLINTSAVFLVWVGIRLCTNVRENLY